MCGLTAKGDIVEMCWRLDGLELASDVEVLYAVVEIGHGRMSGVIGTEDLDSLLDAVRLVHILSYTTKSQAMLLTPKR